MRLLIALTLPVAGLVFGNVPVASADDAAVIGPLPSLTRAPVAAISSFGLVLPEEPESPPTPADEPTPADGTTPADTPSPATAPPHPTVPVQGVPDESYEEISAGYPAPAHSLVPHALSTGPLFRGAGNRGGAYGGGTHLRYPYYNYRSPWTYGGPVSVNQSIHW